MDILALNVRSETQKAFWQALFHENRAQILPKKTQVLIFVESWNHDKGAGNGLGTLWTYQQLKALDLKDKKVALLHAAGLGTRLEPLSSREVAGKAALLLPSNIPGGIRLLEAILVQVLEQELSFKNRLNVFWADQLFEPSIPLSPPSSPLALFARKLPYPDKETWQAKQLHHYGLIAKKRHFHLHEKLSFEQFKALYPQEPPSLFSSLGSFSISYELLDQFCDSLSLELNMKTGHLNSDHDLWIPLLEKEPALLEPIDIGADSKWWDLGSLSSLKENLLSLLKPSPLNHYLKLKAGQEALINSDCKSAELQDSLVFNCHFESIKAQSAVLINCRGKTIDVEDKILYNEEFN